MKRLGGLNELAAVAGLSDDAEARLRALLELLATDPLAPTTVRDPRRVLEDHLADSLVALQVKEVQQARSIADLGAGAGLPGLPLAIALPRAEVFLVESNGRKCEFISRAIQVVKAPNARVVCARVEDWAGGARSLLVGRAVGSRPGPGSLDLVTARALAPLPVVAEYAAPLLRLGGALLAWRGRLDPEEDAATAGAAEELGLDVREPLRVRPYPAALHRHLQLLVKTGETPPRFPRRPGMARKRPLGAPRRAGGIRGEKTGDPGPP